MNKLSQFKNFSINRLLSRMLKNL